MGPSCVSTIAPLGSRMRRFQCNAQGHDGRVGATSPKRIIFRALVVRSACPAGAEGRHVSQLVSATVDGQKLSNTEIGGFFRLLLGAGHDTTKNLLSNGTLTLIEHSAERRRLQEDPTLIPGTVEEMLRFTPSVLYFRRNAARETELRGKKIAARATRLSSGTSRGTATRR